ncbi:MAG: hypothetical protein ACRCSV_05130 [Chlamydiales bacterium]
MLGFLRKNQKYFLLVISIVIITSFIFVGINQKIPKGEVKKEILLGRGVDGSSIYVKEIEQMVRFCVTDRFDQPSMKNGIINFLNDGVIRKDIIESGLANLLLENDFDRIRPDLQDKISQFQKFSSYIHPENPSISLENIYAKFSPELFDTLQKFRLNTEISPNVFSQVVSMYQQQQKLQPELIRQFLMYEEKMSKVKPDPHLINKDLQLFHAYSLDEWFGKKFIELTCQFIHHCALEAKHRGYSIPLEEVQTDLQRKSWDALQSLAGKQKLSVEDFSSYYHQLIHLLNMQEEEVLLIWQKVMLFRRLLQDVVHGVVFEGSGLSDYFTHAKEKVSITKYEIPESLIGKNMWDILELQLYITKTSSSDNILHLPTESLPIAEIKSQTPELLEHAYEISIVQKSLHDLFQYISLQEMWKWQMNNWDLLQDTFLDIRSYKSDLAVDRLHYLDKLDHALRTRIDEFTKKQILKADPARVQEILSNITFDAQIITLPIFGTTGALKGFDNNIECIAFLDEHAENKLPVNKIDFDQEIFYQIQEVVKKGESVISFARAKEEGILNDLLHKELQSFYNSDSYFKNKQSFEEIKELIGLKKYQSLFQELDEWAKAHIDDSIAGPEMYIKYRLYPWLLKQRDSLQDSNQTYNASTYEEQWKLEKSISVVTRAEAKLKQLPEEIFDSSINNWSSICLFDEEKLGFLQINNRIFPKKEEFTSFILSNQSMLFLEMKHELTRELLQTFPKIPYVEEVSQNA